MNSYDKFVIKDYTIYNLYDCIYDDYHIKKRFIVKAFQRRYRPELINGKIDRELCYIAKKISNSLA